MTNHLAGGPPAKLFVCTFVSASVGFIDNKVRDSTPHTPFRSSIWREGGDPILLTVFVAPAALYVTVCLGALASMAMASTAMVGRQGGTCARATARMRL